jgi:hypothetical protein
MRRSLGPATIVGLIMCTSGVAHAQTWELWPEFDAYIPIAPATQLNPFVNLTQSRDTTYRQIEIGTYLDWRLASYLVLGGGYSYLYSPDAHSNNEDRAMVEGTVEFHLPADLHVADRNRFDFRWVGGVYSTRYRNRLRLSRPVDFDHDRTVTPYVEVEIYYQFNSASISRVQTQIGAVWELSHHVTLDGAYVHQNDQTGSLNNVNAINLTVRLYTGGNAK